MGFVTGPTHISVGSSLNITSNANCSISSLFDVLNVIKRVFSMSAIIWLQESKAPSTVFCNKSIFLSKTLLDLKQSKSSSLILATLYSKLSSADRILSSLSLSSESWWISKSIWGSLELWSQTLGVDTVRISFDFFSVDFSLWTAFRHSWAYLICWFPSEK